MNENKKWNTDNAKLHYRITNWGLGLFDINTAGHVTVKADSSEVDLYELSQQLKQQGINLPVLVRFPHLLQKLLSTLSSEFNKAISNYAYPSNYVAAYPIKVNQQATVIQHFDDQTQWPIAFEVGSKAELIACLGSVENKTIICNGYKDKEYIRLALVGGLLGHEVIIVIESLLECQHVLELSNELHVVPVLGMRIRLSSIAEGNWQNTGGKRSKFGLTTNQALQLINKLYDNSAVEWMQMLHFHMGSQIPSLHDIQVGVVEGMRYFAELTRLGIKLSMLNVGGGLAVDYEGSNSNSYFSVDYSICDYANTVVKIINNICKEEHIKAPTIFTENGRVMTAYHAVLLTNVIKAENQELATSIENKHIASKQKASCLTSLVELSDKIQSALSSKNKLNVENSYSQLTSIFQDLEKKFSQGVMSLTEKAQAEAIYAILCQLLLRHEVDLSHTDNKQLEEMFIGKYFCNFSLFQSTPDVWGLGQIFPILPLHHLHIAPQQKVHIHDLTCDSDGQIDFYVEREGISPYLTLHELSSNEDYVLGFFLVGAYQEILGDLHNLFGDTNAVNIELKPDGGYHICEEEPGDTIEEILSYVHIDSKKIRKTWGKKLNQIEMSEKRKSIVLQVLEYSLQTNNYLN